MPMPRASHLLINRPAKTVALEAFLLDRCKASHHIAILTIWYLSAHLSDVSAPAAMRAVDSPARQTCLRVMSRVEAILFPSQSPMVAPRRIEPTTPSGVFPRMLPRREKVNPHAGPAFVGMGLILAGVAAPRAMLEPMSKWVVEEGRSEWKEEQEEAEAAADTADTHTLAGSAPTTPSERPLTPTSPTPKRDDSTHSLPQHGLLQRLSSSLAPVSLAPTIEDLHRGKAFSFTRFVERALPSTSKRSSLDVTQGSQNPPSKSGLAWAYSNILGADNNDPPSSVGDRLSRMLLGDKEKEAMLQSHYFHSEMQFVMALVQTSARLVNVPRPARQSSLEAELTLLNHNLPADVCIPLWCPASAERPYHHQVVRIPVKDSTVLNSADRVPYLLLVEVLENDSETDIRALQREGERHLQPAPLPAPVDSGVPTDVTLMIDVDDTDELFGGVFYKKKKVVRDREARLKRAIASMEKDEAEEGSRDTGSAAAPHGPTARPPGVESVLAVDTDDHGSATYSMVRAASEPAVPPMADSVPTAIATSPASDVSSPKPPMRALSLNMAAGPSPETAQADSRGALGVLPVSRLYPTTPNLAATAQQRNMSPRQQYFPRVRRRSSVVSNGVGVGFGAAAQDEFSERMRTAAVMLAQLAEASRRDLASPPPAMGKPPHSTGPASRATRNMTIEIREKIVSEMMALEEQRQAQIQARGTLHADTGASGEALDDEREVLRIVKDKDDPSAAVFKEQWEAKKRRIRAASPFGHYPNWRLLSVIVKTGSDLRQEQLACQLIKEMQRIWHEAQVDVWVRTYRVLVTGADAGLIETVTDSISIHSLKKDAYNRRLNQHGLVYTLTDHFLHQFGPAKGEGFKRAQDNFIRSLAAYSVVSYVLQLKDRHNGNVLLDNEGHVIHIDFGFMLQNSPGSVGFEMAPFKLPQEYLDLMGGVDSDQFEQYKTLVKQAFLAVRKYAENLVLLIEMMQKDSRLPCFSAGEGAAAALRERFQPALNETQVEEYVDRLIMSSCGNVFTRLYDTFQYYSNGIL